MGEEEKRAREEAERKAGQSIGSIHTVSLKGDRIEQNRIEQNNDGI